MTNPGGPQVLLAGDVGDVQRIRMVLDHAVPCVYGQIYIEIEDGQAYRVRAMLPEDLPDGLSLTLLTRGPASAPGETLASALTGWAAEWATDDATETDEIIAMWVGCSGTPAVDVVCRSLAARLNRTPVHLHRD
ncbi:hypothetical protein ET495_06055 [Xylanimonas allomyrinae]|uniref:Siderophore-interacting protein C-terminal domain-containing protein n=1 Tax=Xylanimonas allomyrinae TaxID=2509459 RepID=A0A4V0YE40_9MICO|nr:hypothetical protein [Xylanimonas allomyrinae]QAY62881.1 hypothetical protein ET495_06055 [Xylanimonas allomyrinae]